MHYIQLQIFCLLGLLGVSVEMKASENEDIVRHGDYKTKITVPVGPLFVNLSRPLEEFPTKERDFIIQQIQDSLDENPNAYNGVEIIYNNIENILPISVSHYPGKQKEREEICSVDDTRYGNTPLHNAVLFSHLLSAQQIISSLRVDINATNNLGDTPLLLAVRMLNPDMTRLLLNNGADAEKSNSRTGWTPLASVGELFWARVFGATESEQELAIMPRKKLFPAGRVDDFYQKNGKNGIAKYSQQSQYKYSHETITQLLKDKSRPYKPTLDPQVQADIDKYCQARLAQIRQARRLAAPYQY